MNKFRELCQQLEDKIKKSYEQGVTLEDAEKLAGEFLYAQLQVSQQLKTASLDARMRKSGVKAIRAAIYLNIVQNQDGKRPTEANIAAMIDSDKLSNEEQLAYDTAEVSSQELERFYNIFSNAHIFYRGISKGKFE